MSLVVSTGPANASGHDDHAGQGHSRYVQTNLVADTPGKAQVTDPNLVNPWGVSYGPITFGDFLDPKLPFGYSRFNVQVLGGKVYVAYAKIDRSTGRDIHANGLGRVDVFDVDGNLLSRIHQTSDLNAPWGMTIAPAGFGKLSGDLLVGNFGDGRIHAYSPRTLKELGSVRNARGRAIIIDGLWALTPGNGAEAGTDQVIFTAGPHNGMHGLLGTLSLR